MRLTLGQAAGISAAIGFTLAACLTAGAKAQSLAPMTANVGSMSERFLVRLTVGNPYPGVTNFKMLAYDLDNRPIDLWINTPEFSLKPGAIRQITASAPFDGAALKQVLICAESVISKDTGTNLRGQVCSRVTARRLSSPSAP